MGNFYTNIVVREADIDRVVSVVEGLRRRAYVATVDDASVVYDERCDDQDLNELQRLAGRLSEKLGRPALAFCNHDDDVLWYALADGGKVVDTYDSCPGYFEGESREPKGGDAARLCAAFGVEDRRSEVDALLRQDKRAVTFEAERHEQLLALLRLPKLALLGFRYVEQGEATDVAPDAILRAVGTASEVDASAQGDASTNVQIDPQVLEAMEQEGGQMLANAAALAFAEVDVPSGYEGVLPAGRMNGYAVMMRLQGYLVAHRLLKGQMVRPDEALAGLFGPEPFAHMALSRKVREAFSVPPLSEADEAALRAGDLPFLLRFHDAMRRATAEGRQR